MKTQCLTLILGLWSLSGFTQELVSCSGDHFEANGLQLDFSIGEAVTETLESGVTLTQGFHQTLLTITSVSEVPYLNWQAGPNPVVDVLNVQFAHGQISNGFIELLNMQGQVVLSDAFGMVQNLQLDLSDLAPGVYVMRANNLQQQPISQTLLIQKL